MEVCRLCLELLQEATFSKLTEPYKCIINNVVPEAELDITINPVICQSCSGSIDELHKFKLLCYDSQQKLLKGKKRGQPNLTAQQILYGSSKKNKDINYKICRTCLESIEREHFTALTPPSPDAYLEGMLTMCLPEVNLTICKEPVMCEKCFGSLQKLHYFKTSCLDIEQALKEHKLKKDPNSKDPIDLHVVLAERALKLTAEYSDVCVKEELVNEDDSEVNLISSEGSERVQIKEEIDVKMEDIEIPSDEAYITPILPPVLTEQLFPTDEEQETPQKKEISKLDEIMKEVVKTHKQEIHYSCSQCMCTMENKRHYITHMLMTHTTCNEESRLMHFCHLCNYQTVYQQQMRRHIGNFHVEKEKLHCPFCTFTSNYTLNLKKHIMIHEDMQQFSCAHPQCDFKTSYKCSLERHEVKIHGNQCSMCEYKNRNRADIQRHLRVVHDVYEIHHCSRCSFKTCYLMTLKRHIYMKHKELKPKNNFALWHKRNNFVSVKKTKDQLTSDEEDEIRSMFKHNSK